MIEFDYPELKKFLTTNVKGSYCILMVHDGSLEIIAMKKPGTNNRWLYTRCPGRYDTPKGMKELPFDALFDTSAPVEIFAVPGHYHQACSQRKLIASLLYDTTRGEWYDGYNPLTYQTEHGGTAEFILLKKNADNSYSLLYLDDVAVSDDFRKSTVAKNLIYRIYDSAYSHTLKIHYPEFIRIGKIDAPRRMSVE